MEGQSYEEDRAERPCKRLKTEVPVASPITTHHRIEYIVQGGLRHVKPYIHNYEAWAKGRWFGKPIIEVYEKEFGTYPPEYYADSIEAGTITVNGQRVHATYHLKNGDKIVHRAHCHEPPVVADEVKVVAQNAEIVAVDKPPTVPIHPCGAYRHNSLTRILAVERPDLLVGGHSLLLLYRLDRLTSGLVLFARTRAAASRIAAELRDKSQTKKIYLARVQGDLSRLLAARSASSTTATADGDEIQCRESALHAAHAEEEVPQSLSSTDKELLFDDWGMDHMPRDGDGEEEEEVGVEDDEEHAKGSKDQRRERKRENKQKRKVAGEAPSAEQPRAALAPVEWHLQSDGSIRIRAGIRCVSHRDAIYEVSPEGKPSTTIIRLKATDGSHSVVECRPVTGRTHQIRLHLQWLGFPIVNDPNYGDPATVRSYKEQWVAKQRPTDNGSSERPSPDKQGQRQDLEDLEVGGDQWVERLCPYCKDNGQDFFRGDQLHHRGIWLHAWNYQGRSGWSYQTDLPSWASEVKRSTSC